MDVTRLLRATRGGACAGAEFEARGELFVCVRAAPMLRWLVGLGSAEAAARLRGAGWRVEWL